jgi:hypothetical protein
VTATSPMPRPLTGPRAPDASSRRAPTPTWLEGTTTVTGARGSPALAAAMEARSACAASPPYRTHWTDNPMAEERTEGV